MTEIILQLASPSKNLAPTVTDALDILVSQGYIFDMKWDGVRCVVHMEHGKVTHMVNRRNLEIAFRYADVVACLEEALPSATLVLDGEIVCMNADGMPDFGAIHRRDAQQSAHKAARLISQMPATFIPFDVLADDTMDLRRMPYRVRRDLLQRKLSGQDAVTASLSVEAEHAHNLWKLVCERGMEGLIAKRATSIYKGGRQRDWIKLKQTYTLSALASGYTPGEGKRAGLFGSITLALVGTNSLIDFGEVGTGFSDREVLDLKRRLDAQAAATEGFEPLILEVEVGNVTRDGKPRHPSYKGIRTDLTMLDCSVDQLAGIPVI